MPCSVTCRSRDPCLAVGSSGSAPTLLPPGAGGSALGFVCLLHMVNGGLECRSAEVTPRPMAKRMQCPLSLKILSSSEGRLATVSWKLVSFTCFLFTSCCDNDSLPLYAYFYCISMDLIIINITYNGDKSDKEFPTQSCYDNLTLGKEKRLDEYDFF